MKKRRRPTNRYRDAEKVETETRSRMLREAVSGDHSSVRRAVSLLVKGLI